MERKTETRRRAMSGWVLPALLYIVFLGAAGVTTKLALRTITWEQMVLWWRSSTSGSLSFSS
jgi:hypothetical protein